MGVVNDWYTRPELAWPDGSPILVPEREEHFRDGFLVVRSGLPRVTAISASNRAIRDIVPGAPIRLASDFERLLRQEFVLIRILARFFSTLAIVSLFFAFGTIVTLTYGDVVMRRKELGIRCALGARTAELAAAVMRRYVFVLVVSGVLTTLLAMWSTTLIRTVLISALLGRPGGTLPEHFVVVPSWLVAGILGGTVAVATARRLGRLNPAGALREEEEAV